MPTMKTQDSTQNFQGGKGNSRMHDTRPTHPNLTLASHLVGPREKLPRPHKVFGIQGKKALFMSLLVRFSNGFKHYVEFLVDTGAEFNLIRPDLVPPGCLGEPSKFIRLVVANNEALVGGDKACQVEVTFFWRGSWS